MRFNFRDIGIRQKLWFIAGLSILGMLVIAGISISNQKEIQMAEKRLKTRHLVEVAHGVLSRYYDLSRSGGLSEEEAKAGAVAAVKSLRYEGEEYFWINDMHPTMVMHPYKKELDGQVMPKVQKTKIAHIPHKAAAGV
ncbi:MAG: hypothetical protein FIA94_15300 [Nitrospirae bacterium]|nr:hypothetical protein [Nitrospirota bacterium]